MEERTPSESVARVYSDEEIREFMEEDALDEELATRIQEFLAGGKF